MPTYPEGTYEWALARIKELKSDRLALTNRLMALGLLESRLELAPWGAAQLHEEMAQRQMEFFSVSDELVNQLDSLPHGEPSYSREELEEAGQMVLDVGPDDKGDE